MKEINTKDWNHFNITDFLDNITVRIKLGNKHISDNGTIPVYSSSTERNGLFGYTESNATFIVDEDNPYYIIFGDHTKSMFLIKHSFCVMDNVKVLKPNKYDELFLLFLLTSWRKSIPDLGYARHWSEAKTSVFKLPVNSNGEPDYDYMHTFMEKKLAENTSKLNSYLSAVNNLHSNEL
ncbi:restriction endonuclease subunit S [Mammaliicoccus sciuri]|uniref:restriction endonuclease subunit S n=1 Tax=Mammaliicoccus sciuri TaxID=1296 RepID=UPI000D1D7729|nr:restriction endonuclease subunit S [Mammaliicoccus sciuri]PTK05742.1 hypothetical protein BUZ89_12035 [Mammaliicoccus sciuri]